MIERKSVILAELYSVKSTEAFKNIRNNNIFVKPSLYLDFVPHVAENLPKTKIAMISGLFSFLKSEVRLLSRGTEHGVTF